MLQFRLSQTLTPTVLFLDRFFLFMSIVAGHFAFWSGCMSVSFCFVSSYNVCNHISVSPCRSQCQKKWKLSPRALLPSDLHYHVGKQNPNENLAQGDEVTGERHPRADSLTPIMPHGEIGRTLFRGLHHHSTLHMVLSGSRKSCRKVPRYRH